MATARDVIKRGYRASNLLSIGVDPSSDDAVAGLDVLNQMMDAFRIDGIHIGHNTLDLDDTVVVDAAYIEPIVYNLAVRLAAESGRAAPLEVQRLAVKGERTLRAATFEYPDDLRVDRGLRRMPNTYHGDGRRAGYNIETD